MMHEQLQLSALQIRERYTFAVLGALTLWHIVTFRREYLSHAPAVFAAALALFATAVGVDMLEEQMVWRFGNWAYPMEDGPKWLGIAMWSFWHVSYAFYVNDRKGAA